MGESDPQSGIYSSQAFKTLSIPDAWSWVHYAGVDTKRNSYMVHKYGKLEKPVWDVFLIGKAFSIFELFVLSFTDVY